jgi:uncharacterized protein with HEPN domain
MSKREATIILEDMLEAVNSILTYVKGITFDKFQNDKKTVDAVLRNLTIIGEAARQLPLEFKNNHADIEWDKIARSRNIIVHDYFKVDHEIIWRIITTYLPPLQKELNILIKN